MIAAVAPVEVGLHLAGTGVAALAFGAFLLRYRLGRATTALLVLGFGSVTHTAFEVARYLLTEGITQPQLIASLGAGLAGAALAAALTAAVLWGDRAAPERPAVRVSSEPALALGFNVAVKLALAGLVAFYLLFPDLPQFEGKAMWFRSAFAPVFAFAVPAIALLRGTRPYPHLADALIVLVLVIDTAGNAADLYRFEWFDHSVHFVNTALIATAAGLLIARLPIPGVAPALLALGITETVHTLWEIFEWTGNTLWDLDLDTTYPTTSRDLAAGLAGATTGAVATAIRGRRRRGSARGR